MAKIKLEDLQRIKEEVRSSMTLREGGYRAKITVHMGTCGIAAGARDVMSAVMEYLEKNGIKDVIVATSGCAGLCSREPMATVEILGEAPVKYIELSKDKMLEIMESHIMGGNTIEKYAIAVGSETAV
jgi:NADP-reducing hydrogenase subunit HndB